MILLLKDKKTQIIFFFLLFIVEVILSLYTGLPYDMKIWFETGRWLNQGINIYLPENHLGYPPLWALWCSFSYSVYSLLGSSIETWRFLIKIPIIISHVFLAYFLGNFVSNHFGRAKGKEIFFATLTWSFIIYIGALWGQINVITALLTFLAFTSLIDNKLSKSALLLGIAVTLKIYPLVALPAFLIYALNKNGKGAVAKILLWVSAVPLTFTLGIFAIFRWDLLYFLKTIFYWTPVFETTQTQIQSGCMNFWSFAYLFGIDVGSIWFLRTLWIPALIFGFIWFLRKKPRWNHGEFNLAIIVLYSLFIVSYGWATEQMFVDLIPFILLQVMIFTPKSMYFKLFLIIQALIFSFSAVNYGAFIFLPLIEIFIPSAEASMQFLVPAINPVVSLIRGFLGLFISILLLVNIIFITNTTSKRDFEIGENEG